MSVSLFARPLARRADLSRVGLLALLLAVAAVFAPGARSTAAAAECAPLGSEDLEADQAHFAIGDTVQLTGSGFAPSCDVALYVISPDGSARAEFVVTDASGTLTHTLTLGTAAGWYQIDAYGADGVSLAGAGFTNGPLLMTDKGDYRDSETVQISGFGFSPLSDVTVRVTRPDGSVVTGDGTETPGADIVASDPDGAFSYEYIIRSGTLAEYLVEALGRDGSPLADTFFTDSGAFVNTIGTNAKNSGANSSITLTVPAAGVAAGNSIIVGLQVGGFAGAISCSDPKNGTYNTDVANPASGATRIAVASKHNVVALLSGDVITCTYPLFSGSSLVTANQFAGLAAAPLDKTAVGSGSTAGAISTAAVTTTQPDEVLFGLFYVTNTNRSFTPGPGYTVVGSAPPSPNSILFPMYSIVFATGDYPANASISGSGVWNGVLATYKVAALAQGQIKIVKNTTGGNDTFGFTVSGTSSASPSVTTSGGTGQTTITVPAGGYSLSETTLPAGWVAGAATCDSGTPASFTVPVGGTVTCTFSNTAQGKIQIDKTTIGADASFGFTISGPTSSSPSVATSGGSGSTGLITVTAGTYSVSETTLPAGWVATGSSCDAGTPASFTVPVGGTVTCSFTNTAQGHIKIDKTTIGGDATFGFTISGPTASTPSILTSGGSGTTGLITVTAGSYSISETTIPAGWVATDSSCDSGTPGGFTVPVGGAVTCTFTNTAQGQIQINKTAIGGDATFGFTISGPSASAPTITTVAGSGTTGLITVTAGSYSISETTVPAGWSLTGSSCTSGTPAGFTVPVGTTVACSFTNTGQGQVKLVKNTTGGNGTFKFAVSGPTPSTPTITTTLGTGTTGFVTVTAGSYSVSENAIAGWSLTGAVCSSGTPGNFAVAVGDQVTCTFTNDKDTDGDGIPDAIDCTPTVKDTIVVDPRSLVPASFTGARFATLQAAVSAAADNSVISMYGDTVENVVIGDSTGSGGKDLLIVGCGRKIHAQDGALPVIHIERSAGKSDGSAGIGKPAQERDIQVVDLDVIGGSVGYFVETTKPAAGGTDTLLKAVRAERNSVGIKIVGDGNEVRGANGVNDNGGIGIDVGGNKNLIADNRVHDNGRTGIHVQGDGNLVKTNKVGDADAGNLGDGIDVAGTANTIQENDVFANAGAGIVVAGSGNQLLKNDVGDTGKGNGGIGISITGDSNTLGKALYENNVFANGGAGMAVTGNNNVLVKNDVGDRGKGNAGDGMRVTGYGNTLQENSVFANAGDGITVAGGTSAKPNVVLKNAVGDRSKGNGGNGISVASAGNGNTSPVELEQNTVKSNRLDGIRVVGTGHQLKNNLSGGSGSFPTGDDNGKCEFNVASGNVNATGNKANGATIAGTSGSAFPTACQGTP